jgi:hypothetical protein
VVPGFPDHANQVQREELVGGFTAAAATVMTTINVEDIVSGGQGP